MHQPGGLRAEIVDVEPVEVCDRALGMRSDPVVERHQLGVRPAQPGGVSLGPGGKRPVFDPLFEFGEAFGQLAFRHDVCSPVWYAVTVSRMTRWNCRISSSWSLRWKVLCARVFSAECVASM